MKRRAADILVYFDHARTSNGPTETSSTTSPALCSTPVDSGPDYTHFYEEPLR